jgi:hypothetical protein
MHAGPPGGQWLLLCRRAAALAGWLPTDRRAPRLAQVGTDVSATCLQQLQAAAAAEGIDASRLRVLVADGAAEEHLPLYQGMQADVVGQGMALAAILAAARCKLGSLAADCTAAGTHSDPGALLPIGQQPGRALTAAHAPPCPPPPRR